MIYAKYIEKEIFEDPEVLYSDSEDVDEKKT